jgi:ribosome assembly protein YihI (activator of Der GTPase)
MKKYYNNTSTKTKINIVDDNKSDISAISDTRTHYSNLSKMSMKSAKNFVRQNTNNIINKKVLTRDELLFEAEEKKKEKHRQLMAQSRNSKSDSKKEVKKEKVKHIMPTRSTSEDMSPNLETIKQQPLTKKNLSRLQNLFSFGELEKNDSRIQKLDNFERGTLP